jgi:signal transduction histidine kinase/CheY-like chemotaxis protein
MSLPILRLALHSERDVVLARQRARQIAQLTGFEAQDQTRFATAVSEIARNAFRYASRGSVQFEIHGETTPQLLSVLVTDEGPGVADLDAVLAGAYRSETGMGLGISGTRRLMDRFDIVTEAGRGTSVTFGKLLPRQAPMIDGRACARIADELARQESGDPFQELQRQNQELLQTLDHLERRQTELAQLNRELEDTNRGVVALYAELDERADRLRRADDLKSRFLSNMSHEFRTPVNSIQALCRMLLDRDDGELNDEQDRQVQFILRAAESLSELVNDLLDLAKVEAGKLEVYPAEFDVGHLFGALRGMLRPLLLDSSVSLVFEGIEGERLLWSDEAKVSQILRNFISNALKFTEQGEVRVAAQLNDDGTITFSVRDTGIGIEAEQHERIFQEFTQIDSPTQRRVKGTGLGLPLSRKLAELLGGSVGVESAPGKGSTFTATIPVVFEGGPESRSYVIDPDLIPVLLVEDSAETAFLYERTLERAGYQVLTARDLRSAREALATVRPRVVLLDLLLRGEDSWPLLADLKRDPQLCDIPVVIVSTVEDQAKGIALGASAYLVKPVDPNEQVKTVETLAAAGDVRRVLVIDDEEVFRYVLSQYLDSRGHAVLEASNGAEGLELARSQQPDVIFLDINMPGITGREVLRRLKADPATRSIPVLVFTSADLTKEESLELLEKASDVIRKDALDRDRVIATIDGACSQSARTD